MSHKTLTISEEAYEALAELKKEGESFTALCITSRDHSGNINENWKTNRSL